MHRSELEHILRASKSVTGEPEFIVIGSQCILGPFPDAMWFFCWMLDALS